MQLKLISRELLEHPPTHILVAALVGYKGPGHATRANQPTWQTESVEELFARWTAAGGSVG